MRKRKLIPFILFSAIFLKTFATDAQAYSEHYVLKWQITNNQNTKSNAPYFLGFPGAVYKKDAPEVPCFEKSIGIAGFGTASVSLSDEVYEPVNETAVTEALKSHTFYAEVQPSVMVTDQAHQDSAKVSFIPIRMNVVTGHLEELVSFTVHVTVKASHKLGKTTATSSVLASGNWYKIGVTQTGMYKLDYSFLSKLGITGGDPKNLKIYGKAGGILPEANAETRDDDLVENAIQVVDNNNNGSLDAGDYALFYAKGPVSWAYNGQRFAHQTNYYSDTAYYFVTIDGGPGKRVAAKASLSGTPTHEVTEYDGYMVHEVDKFTEMNPAVRSGRDMFGEMFKSYDGNPVVSMSFDYDFPNIDASAPAKLFTFTAGHSPSHSQMNWSVNGEQLLTNSYAGNSLNFENITEYYADQDSSGASFTPNGTHISISASYMQVNDASRAFLDYFELNVRNWLKYTPGQFDFRDISSVSIAGINRFHIQNGDGHNLVVWDVSDFHNVAQQQLDFQNGEAVFQAAANTLNEYVAFDNSAFYTPAAIGKVANQNIHGLPQPDMVIVTYPGFMDAAKRFADFHHQHDGFLVHVLTPQQIYNEFSSGTQDVSAIRDMMKMFYDRGTNGNKAPRFLLLLGAASYDYKNLVPANSNYVPCFESRNSVDPAYSFGSDDYFGFLSDNEGGDETGQNYTMDVAIGRITARDDATANAMLDKIMRYTSPQGLKDWRNLVCFACDDQESNLFFNDAQNLVSTVNGNDRDFNILKIYSDAYKQYNTASGQSYPDVNKAITQQMQSGMLVFNYVGHGSENGLSAERILQVQDINSWTNKYNMPLFITATCEFSRFDNPQQVSAGEQVLLNPNGGAIALYSTTRTVEDASNMQLNQAVLTHNLLEREASGLPKFIGEIFQQAKNATTGIGSNDRNFALLGDPAVRLAVPQYDVKVTSITNSKTGKSTDSLKALSLVTIKGEVSSGGHKIDNFNGTVYPTIYDKPNLLQTLANDNTGNDISLKAYFYQQNSIIYKGQATVHNGEFSFSFIIPKDISFKTGNGKISFYVQNGQVDGNGYCDSIVVGGSDPTGLKDVPPPTVNLFMNDSNFKPGGLVNQNPLLLANVHSEVGINTAGSGVGHDITATITNASDAIVLNNYYQANLDDYQNGKIAYNFSNLPDGSYHLKLTVWDVLDNPGEASTDFIVASSEKLAIAKIFNFPNPLTDQTTFQFEYNRPDEDLNVKIDIYDMQGQLMKQIKAALNTSSSRVTGIQWDGTSDGGARLGQGMYVYRLTVTTADGQTAQQSQRLVVIR
jgi:hypothetical protein